MSDSVYRVTEVIGTSSTSWEEAAKNAVETAAKTLRDLRVGEVALGEHLDDRLGAANLGDDRVRARLRDARVEHLDDHIL